MKHKLSAVIVLYNPDDNYLNVIDNIKNFVDKIYLVSNGNKSNIIPLLDSKIKYIDNKENLGIATALNIGAKNAIQDGMDWLLTLDQDSCITKSNIFDLLEYVNNHDVDKIGIISLYQDIGINLNVKDDVEEMLEVMTSGNIINLDIYEKVGGFKDWLFIDGVDIEYGLNLNKNGYKVIRLNNSKMKHSLGNTNIHNFFGKKIICSNHSALRRYYMVRNNLYIRDMYKDVFPDYCKFLIDVQKGQLKRVLFFEKNKLKKIKYMYKGYSDYKKNVRGKFKEK